MTITTTTITNSELPLVQTGQGEHTQRFTPRRAARTSQAKSKLIDLSSFLIEESDTDYYSKCNPPYITSGLLNLFRHCPLEFCHNFWYRSKSIQPKHTDGFNRCSVKYAKKSMHENAHKLLAEGGVANGVIRYPAGEYTYQGRLSWVNPDPNLGIVELKTTVSLDTFELDIIQNDYVHQLAFYRQLIFKVSGHILPAHLIAVEVDNPYKCGVWRISQASLDIAQADNDAAIVGIAKCKKYNSWPTGYEQVRTFDYARVTSVSGG